MRAPVNRIRNTYWQCCTFHHQLPMKSQSQKQKKRGVNMAFLTIDERNRVQKRMKDERQSRSSIRVVQTDFITNMLARLTFLDIIRYTKLLLIIINRTEFTPNMKTQKIDRKPYIRHHCEYYDSAFADYAMLDYTGENEIMRLSFRDYYNMMYRNAKQYSLRNLEDQTREGRVSLAIKLKACFIIALTHDIRIKKFVFRRHDIHFHYLNTTPTCSKKGIRFINDCKTVVNRVFHNDLSLVDMYNHCIELWEERYRFVWIE